MLALCPDSCAAIPPAHDGPRWWQQSGAQVESLNGVPIVVERSMYWNGGALFWGGGTSEAGVRIR